MASKAASPTLFLGSRTVVWSTVVIRAHVYTGTRVEVTLNNYLCEKTFSEVEMHNGIIGATVGRVHSPAEPTRFTKNTNISILSDNLYFYVDHNVVAAPGFREKCLSSGPDIYE